MFVLKAQELSKSILLTSSTLNIVYIVLNTAGKNNNLPDYCGKNKLGTILE